MNEEIAWGARATERAVFIYTHRQVSNSCQVLTEPSSASHGVRRHLRTTPSHFLFPRLPLPPPPPPSLPPRRQRSKGSRGPAQSPEYCRQHDCSDGREVLCVAEAAERGRRTRITRAPSSNHNKISTLRRQLDLACCVTLIICFALRTIAHHPLAIERRRQTATAWSFHSAVARVSSIRSVAFGRSTAVGPAFIATTVTTPALPTCPVVTTQHVTPKLLP